MPSAMPQPSALKLSICITTFNRATFIGTTLESILAQLTSDCEVVVLDGASTDDTGRIVSEYARRSNRLRYVRQETNNGIDRDYDGAVEIARGEYCWLMTDDDIMMPGAVAAVLQALQRNLSVIVINAELRDFSLSKVVQARWLDFDADRVYGPGEMDRLFVDVDGWLNCHCFVIKREIWLAREKERYYGSFLVYLGVVFQESLPEEALVIAEPLVSYRRGNTHTYSAQNSAMIWDMWPSIVESLAISESTKRKVYNAQPWRHFWELLLYRGLGYYSLTEYRRWIRPRLRARREKLMPAFIALLPGAPLNALLVFYYSMIGRSHGLMQRDLLLQELRESRFHFRNWRRFQHEL